MINGLLFFTKEVIFMFPLNNSARKGLTLKNQGRILVIVIFYTLEQLTKRKWHFDETEFRHWLHWMLSFQQVLNSAASGEIFIKMTIFPFQITKPYPPRLLFRHGWFGAGGGERCPAPQVVDLSMTLRHSKGHLRSWWQPPNEGVQKNALSITLNYIVSVLRMDIHTSEVRKRPI